VHLKDVRTAVADRYMAEVKHVVAQK